MKKILMYCHGGSANHGCEAIVKSTTDLLKEHNVHDIRLISSKVEEDIKYGVNVDVKLYNEINSPNKLSFSFLKAYFKLKFCKDYTEMNNLARMFPYSDCGKETVSLSIGGDNYCYGDYQKYIDFHNLSKKCDQKTVLWGCSVEPELLDVPSVLNDLKSFDKIITRESLSYTAMINHGLENVKMYPDPAFSLEKDCTFKELPKPNTVGINVSPLIMKYEDNNLILKNYIKLIEYILNETEFNISLIPHVVVDNNNDIDPLKYLMDCFSNTERISLLSDCTCKQLKMHISELRFLVAARTHASIAAYSTCVPTLVAGYSIKSKGIAKDIFGTSNHYVIPVQNLENEFQLANEFKWLVSNEKQIKKILNEVIPSYINKSKNSINELEKLI